MINVPNSLAALVSKIGTVVEPWFSFFQQFGRAPAPILDLDVGASPFAYTVKEPGNIFVTGGTVSSVTLTRGNATPINLVTSGVLIPVCIGDIITVTYSVLPTIRFLPNYISLR